MYCSQKELNVSRYNIILHADGVLYQHEDDELLMKYRIVLTMADCFPHWARSRFFGNYLIYDEGQIDLNIFVNKSNITK